MRAHAVHLRERPFWVIQLGVLSVTSLHWLSETTDVLSQDDRLFHSSVLLYIVPVVYAGLRYGSEGSWLTGAWTALLAVPNIVLWHRGNFVWIEELVSIAFVVGLGGIIAMPVERERLARRQAEAASRRLALLNELATALVRTADLQQTLREVLRQLGHVMGLETSVVLTWDDGATRPTVHACHTTVAERTELVAQSVASLPPPRIREPPHVLEDGLAVIPFPVGAVGEGALLVGRAEDDGISPADLELLEAVAGQLGVALENARLHRVGQERLQTYVHEVTRAQEEERRHIARDLHDVDAHELLLLCRGLDALSDHPPPVDQLRADLEELRARATAVVDHLRRFSRDLRPTLLDNLGLAPALDWLTGELASRSGIDACCIGHGTPRRLAAETELALFRIAQEALRNVERHAAADRVVTEINFLPDRVMLRVQDDGVGFDVPATVDLGVVDGHLGLLGMRERAQLVHGSFQVRSIPSWGTCITVGVDDSRPTTS